MSNSGKIRTRWAAVGAAVAITIGAAGLGGLNIAYADVSTGDRPVFISDQPVPTRRHPPRRPHRRTTRHPHRRRRNHHRHRPRQQRRMHRPVRHPHRRPLTLAQRHRRRPHLQHLPHLLGRRQPTPAPPTSTPVPAARPHRTRVNTPLSTQRHLQHLQQPRRRQRHRRRQRLLRQPQPRRPLPEVIPTELDCLPGRLREARGTATDWYVDGTADPRPSARLGRVPRGIDSTSPPGSQVTGAELVYEAHRRQRCGDRRRSTD